MADDNSTDDVINKDQREESGIDRAGKKAADKAKAKAKKGIKKANEARKKGKYAKGIGKILWPILAIIIIIVMIIGFISFAINMPGSVVDKIMDGMEKIILTRARRWTEKDLSLVSPEDLKDKKLELLNYLKDMGYDVVGMGFVQDINEKTLEDDKSKTIIDWFEEDILVNDNHVTKSIQPSYLFSYYVADERMYVTTNLKLFNKILKNSNATSNWGEGMLNIYGDEGVVDSKEVDRENLTLTFKNTHGFFMTDVYQYNIDGWAGRYGTPLELLLTIHSSTMMPDLVYEFISNENLQTVINIDAQEVKLKVKLKLVGPEGEKDINVGSLEDEAIPINFERNSQTNQYVVSNIGEIKEGLEKGDYSVASLYKGFEAFDTTLNEAATIIGADATQRKIQEIINMDSPYFYTTADVDTNYNSFGREVLLGGHYLGTTSEVNDGASLYDGAVTINSVDKINNHINFTESAYDETSTIGVGLCKQASLNYLGSALKDNRQISDGEVSERFSGEWKEQLRVNYEFIFRATDQYIQNLIDGETIGYDNINYDTQDYYTDRFRQWVDGLESPMEFSEFVEFEGLKDKNQYEKEGKYKVYLEEWSNRQVEPLNTIIADINNDLEVERDTRAIAEKLKQELAKELGLTVEQVNIIYDKFLVQNPDIRTFVPQIKSVVKHWYKDLVFEYKNTAKGTVFEAPYPGECVTNYQLYYQFETMDDKYPVQDGEPYVIKGDIVTRDGKQVDIKEISVDSGTEAVLKDYELGTGYKTARKLFTQGYYYQYDGTKETANEIANAKKIEYYAKGTPIRIILKNSKLSGVEATTEQPIGTEIHRYADEDNKDVATKEKATRIYDTYYVAAPGPYISPADGDTDKTNESVKAINDLYEKIGTDIRRKKVTMSNSTTSLTALAMLEGMHSLDADYIYREFKEFLIELGYYSRAEIESVETSVLDWFIPAFTPDQWPPVKNEEEMLEYGTILKSSSNMKNVETLTVDKIPNLDNFIFYTDTDGIYDSTVLQSQGNNVKFSNTVDTNSIVNEIVNSNPAAICLYVNANSKDDKDAITKTKKLLEDIRAKLKEKEYKSANLPIYVLQILTLESPDIFAETSKEIVNQNKRISDYNTNLYSVCLNQDNVKFIDATNGCVSNEGWLTPDNSASKISENIVSKIVKKNVTNGGFAEGLDVITPGAGYIKAVGENEITIEFSVEKDHSLRSIDGFTIIIQGIALEPGLAKDAEITKGTKIGVTTTENIKLILRDKNKAIIGNIEDYMGLPKNKKQNYDQTIWQYMYFIPWEAGPVDAPGRGPECVAGNGYDEAGVGIIQWTALSGSYNNIAGLCQYLSEKDPELCGELQAFTSWTADQTVIDCATSNSNSQIRRAFANIANKDRDALLQLEMQYCIDDYGRFIPEWVKEHSGVLVGTYMSGLAACGPYSNLEKYLNQSMSEEQLLINLCKGIRAEKGNDSRYNAGWDNRWLDANPSSQQNRALQILNGEIDVEELEQCVRNGF